MFGGGVWPVVQRELRAIARRPWGHWLRVGGALGGVLVFYSLSSTVPFNALGMELFRDVRNLLLFLICAIVPALTADCIARERREGTLGLLFLTPLTASGVVMGKILAQVLRALTVWLSVVPVLAIPFLSGGVTRADVIGFLAIELCVGMLCLAAGVVASSLTESRAIAFILAFLFTAAFLAGFNQFQNWWMFRFSAAPLVEDLVISSIALVLAIRIAGFCVERSWQDKIPSRRRQNWVRQYCTPLFSRSFESRMRRTLEWNPIAWLQQYSWKARLSKWGLCLLFLVLECALIDLNQPDALAGIVSALILALAAAYTFAGVNGFLKDKRSGALEPILISLISVKQIIFGRVWGLWKQFLPVTVLLAASDILVHSMIPSRGYYGDYPGWGDYWFWLKHLEVVVIFLTLPIVATCFALRARSLPMASALTLAVLAGPAAVLFAVNILVRKLELSEFSSLLAGVFLLAIVGQICSASLAYTFVRRSLERRNYSF